MFDSEIQNYPEMTKIEKMCRLIMLLKGEAKILYTNCKLQSSELNELPDIQNSCIHGPEGISISISTATSIKHLSAKICGGSIAIFEFFF